MILNKTITHNVIILLIIIFIASYHYLIQNHLEKKFFKKYFYDFEFIKRPLKNCLNTISYSCIGMPSGHTETITIISCLLYFYKLIPLWLGIFLIFITGLQRIFTNRHTIIQVLFGILFGYIYAKIYQYFNLSIYSFLTVLCFGLFLYLLIYPTSIKLYKKL